MIRLERIEKEVEIKVVDDLDLDSCEGEYYYRDDVPNIFSCYFRFKIYMGFYIESPKLIRIFYTKTLEALRRDLWEHRGFYFMNFSYLIPDSDLTRIICDLYSLYSSLDPQFFKDWKDYLI